MSANDFSVTERARKLRAQYALQAQSLRTRIELRINRIPTALRKANMGDLFEKYMEMSDVKQKTASEKVKPIANKEGPAESEKPLLDSKTCDSMVAPSPRGAKRHRYARPRPYILSCLLELAMQWNLPTRRTHQNPFTKSQIRRSARESPRPLLAKSRIPLQSFLRNQPTHVHCLNHQLDLSLDPLKNPIFPNQHRL